MVGLASLDGVSQSHIFKYVALCREAGKGMNLIKRNIPIQRILAKVF
jgi:hypothetical protein